jgi:uncharacterized protein YbjQ (UPF0145 family)
LKTRNPKTEGNPKIEAPKSEIQGLKTAGRSKPNFGPRISFGFRDFGFRVSDLSLLTFDFFRKGDSCSIKSWVMSQTHPLTTTTFDLPGYRAVKTLGVVRGIIVRSRSIVGNIGAGLQSLFGGNITLYTSMCERARSDAFNQMIAHAGELGANAVIGVRYDATEIATGITEVLCYGTAVYVEQAK